MKKSLLLLSVFSLIAMSASAQMGHSAYTFVASAASAPKNHADVVANPASSPKEGTNSSNRLVNPNPGVQFAGDVIIKSDTVSQRNVKVATAFNGWIYSAYSINSVGYGGIQIRRSKDGGLTWYDLGGGIYPGLDYPSIDLAVAGNDTNNLFVFIAGVYHDLSGGIYTAWIDKYNGATGSFIGEPFNETTGTSPIWDIAIATDSRHPSYLSTPFSLGVVYSRTASFDSVIYNVSIDGGTTFTNRQGVYATGAWCGKVAIAFGIGSTYSNGRYFLAFESKASSTVNDGHVLFTHTTVDPTSSFQIPIYLDSTYAAGSFNNRLGHPRIACSNDGLDNDSSNITTIVFVDRNFNGTDHDVIPIYSDMSVYSMIQNWHPDFGMANTGSYETGGDVAYNEMSRTFCGTYYDSTLQTLIADSININLSAAPLWTFINTQYNDLTTNVIQPFPRISANPVTGTPNFVWNSEGSSGGGVSLFDAMTVVPLGIMTTSSSTEFAAPYPNPSAGTVTFNFTLAEKNRVQLNVVNMLGENVLPVNDLGVLPAGEQLVTMDLSTLANGIYIYRIFIGNELVSGRITVAHQ